MNTRFPPISWEWEKKKKKLSTKWRPLYRILESLQISTWMVGLRVAAQVGFAVTGFHGKSRPSEENLVSVKENSWFGARPGG